MNRRHENLPETDWIGILSTSGMHVFDNWLVC